MLVIYAFTYLLMLYSPDSFKVCPLRERVLSHYLIWKAFEGFNISVFGRFVNCLSALLLRLTCVEFQDKFLDAYAKSDSGSVEGVGVDHSLANAFTPSRSSTTEILLWALIPEYSRTNSLIVFSVQFPICWYFSINYFKSEAFLPSIVVFSYAISFLSYSPISFFSFQNLDSCELRPLLVSKLAKAAIFSFNLRRVLSNDSVSFLAFSVIYFSIA